MSQIGFWDILINLIYATGWTVVLSIISFLGGGILGLILLFARIGKRKLLQLIVKFYTEIFQGTPLL
ncbi:MAG: amino acid ABC transporter permease, partial [Maritimibacter sp.]